MATEKRKMTLRVAEFKGELFKYRVESHSEPGMAHTVDLTHNFGSGVCTCEYHKFCAQPTLDRRIDQALRDAVLCNERCTHAQAARRAHIPYSPGRKGCTECKHIRAAREHFYKYRVRELIRHFTQGVPENVGDHLRKFFKW